MTDALIMAVPADVGAKECNENDDQEHSSMNGVDTIGETPNPDLQVDARDFVKESKEGDTHQNTTENNEETQEERVDVPPSNDSIQQSQNQTVDELAKDTTEAVLNDTVEEPAKESIEQPSKDSVEQKTKESIQQPSKDNIEQTTKASVDHPPKDSVEQATKESVDQPPKDSVEHTKKDSVEQTPKNKKQTGKDNVEQRQKYKIRKSTKDNAVKDGAKKTSKESVEGAKSDGKLSSKKAGESNEAVAKTKPKKAAVPKSGSMKSSKTSDDKKADKSEKSVLKAEKSAGEPKKATSKKNTISNDLSGSTPALRATSRPPRARPASACNGHLTSFLTGRSATSSPVGSVATRRPPKTKSIPIPVPDFPPRMRMQSDSAAVVFAVDIEGPHDSMLTHDSGVFAAYPSPRRREFVIHPEWASETSAQQHLPPFVHPFIGEPPSPRPFLWPKRCKSAPPPTHRNPITWE